MGKRARYKSILKSNNFDALLKSHAEQFHSWFDTLVAFGAAEGG